MTVDKSAPAVTGAVIGEGGAGGGGGGGRSGGGVAGGMAAAPKVPAPSSGGPPALAGLFAGGMPTLKKTGAREPHPTDPGGTQS